MSSWERHQVPLYLAALLVGGVIGAGVPAVAPAAERAITPVLALLLFATFLGIPLREVRQAWRDPRFLSTLLATNLLAVPVIAWGLSRFVADDPGLLAGVLLVLLAPCVDYVIVFTGLAGGDRARLLAATPVLMAAQVLLIPVLLPWLAGDRVRSAISVGPFVEAFVLLIALPLLAAALVQWWAAHRSAGRRVESVTTGAMVPLMMLTLALVVASQMHAVGSRAADLLRLVPLYLGFVLVAVLVAVLAARLARLDVPAARAVVFSTSTRNSLVVLPMALALPWNVAPSAVVTQTLVELVALVILIRIVPRLVRTAQERTR